MDDVRLSEREAENFDRGQLLKNLPAKRVDSLGVVYPDHDQHDVQLRSSSTTSFPLLDSGNRTSTVSDKFCGLGILSMSVDGIVRLKRTDLQNSKLADLKPQADATLPRQRCG